MTDNQAVGALPDTADVAAAERRLAWLEATVLIDPLTGLGNRRAAARAFETALASSDRHDAPVAVALVDIDGLKAINDGHGHAAGDAALVAFADALRRSMRADDTAFRFGGDEFVVLAPGATAAELAQLFDRVQLGAPSFSVGVAQAPVDGTSESELVEVADQRMYAARRSVARTPVVPIAGRRRHLVTAAAVLTLMTLGVPTLAWARHAGGVAARATGTTTTTAVPSTTSTTVMTVITAVAVDANGPILTQLVPAQPSAVNRPVASRTAPVPSNVTTTTTTASVVDVEYEAATVDARGKSTDKRQDDHPRGGRRAKP